MAKQRRDRRTFSEQFKKDLVQQIENGARVSDLAKLHGIQPSQISLWKRKITGKPGKRGRKPGSTNRATAASGSGDSNQMGTSAGTTKKSTRKRAGRRRGASKKSSAAGAPSAAVAPRTSSRASSSGSSNQADVERMIGRLVLENQRLRDQLEGGE